MPARDRRARRVARQRAQHLRDRPGPDGRRRTDGDLLMAHRRERALAVADAAGARNIARRRAPGAVTWLTGYVPDIETGPSPFALSAIAVLAPGGTPVAGRQRGRGRTRAGETGCEVVTYPGFGIGPFDPVGECRPRAGGRCSTRTSVAIDAGSFPAALAADLEWVDVDERARRMRARSRIPDEVELHPSRRSRSATPAGGGTDARPAGHHRARPVGASRAPRWRRAAGARLPVLADLVSGPRTADVGGPPGAACSRTATSCSATSCRASPATGATRARRSPSASRPRRHGRLTPARSRRSTAVVAEIGRERSPATSTARARRARLPPPHGPRARDRVARGAAARAGHATVRLEPGMVVAIEPGSYAGMRGPRRAGGARERRRMRGALRPHLAL